MIKVPVFNLRLKNTLQHTLYIPKPAQIQKKVISRHYIFSKPQSKILRRRYKRKIKSSKSLPNRNDPKQGSAPRRFYRTVYRRPKERFYRTDNRVQNSGFSIPHRQKIQYRYRYRKSGFTASGFSVKPPRCRPLVAS